ncbi:MAG: arginine repressor [Planctomycetota bacterium]|nr:arginine repressor [Planctomycetota bacterium]
MPTKISRHRAISRLVGGGGIQNQAQLATALSHLGFEVTQATLSRDLTELSVLKGTDGYVLAESVGAVGVPDLNHTMRQCLAEVHAGGTIVVLKTAPGQASVLAVAVDGAQLDGVLGTIAGDDCIFVATASDARARSVSNSFRKMIELPTSTPRRLVRAGGHR